MDVFFRSLARKRRQKAVHFFHSQVTVRRGYVWRCSTDLTLREGEGKGRDTRIWVQPPGTPTVGGAFLRAHKATDDRAHFQAALDAAHPLVAGQVRTGGWYQNWDRYTSPPAPREFPIINTSYYQTWSRRPTDQIFQSDPLQDPQE